MGVAAPCNRQLRPGPKRPPRHTSTATAYSSPTAEDQREVEVRPARKAPEAHEHSEDLQVRAG
ncbi:hypothetical protein GCM10027203_77140 [Nonomuraea fastidiosa]